MISQSVARWPQRKASGDYGRNSTSQTLCLFSSFTTTVPLEKVLKGSSASTEGINTRMLFVSKRRRQIQPARRALHS